MVSGPATLFDNWPPIGTPLSEAWTLYGDVAAAYLAAHESYLRDRNGIEFVAELDGISAGGMPIRVKCLHALVAHTLAAGPGVNPIGDVALERATWSPSVCECADYGLAAS